MTVATKQTAESHPAYMYIRITISLHKSTCEFHHGPTHTQCPLITTNEAVITEPFTADDIEVAVNDLSPRSTQSISRATMSPLINALTTVPGTVMPQ